MSKLIPPSVTPGTWEARFDGHPRHPRHPRVGVDWLILAEVYGSIPNDKPGHEEETTRQRPPHVSGEAAG